MSFLSTILQYFFEPLPSGPFHYLWAWVGITVVLFVTSVFLGVYLKKNRDDKVLKKTFKKVPSQLLILSICFGLYLLSRYEHIPFLSMRILDYIVLAITVWIFVKNIQKYLKDYPQAKKQREEKMRLNKYLPKKNSGK